MALKQMEPTEVKVGGITFYITPLGAFKAANLTGELAGVLAPLLGVLAPLVGDGTNLIDVDAGKAAEAMAGCTNISGDKIENLMRKLLLGGKIVAEVPDEEGITEPQILDKDLIDELFCGEIQDMFLLCFHVVKVNFNGFFKRFAGLSGKGESAEEKKPRRIL